MPRNAKPVAVAAGALFAALRSMAHRGDVRATFHVATSLHRWLREIKALCHQSRSSCVIAALSPARSPLQPSHASSYVQYQHVPAVAAPIAPLPSPFDAASAATVEDRARAYLHANCHRPGVNGQGGLDLRMDTTFPAANVRGKKPQYGSAGIPDAMNPEIVAPGTPDRSVLLARVKSTAAQRRMPPISSHVVDEGGAMLLSE